MKECFTQNATRLSPCQNMWSRRTTFAAGTTPRTWTFASTWKHAATWNIQATWKFRTNGLRSFLTHSLKRRLSPREAVKFNDPNHRVAESDLEFRKRPARNSGAFFCYAALCDKVSCPMCSKLNATSLPETAIGRHVGNPGPSRWNSTGENLRWPQTLKATRESMCWSMNS